MKNILILTPNKNEMCGMYQLAKDLAKELNADIKTRENTSINDYLYYDEFITFLYPMHKYGEVAKKNFGKKWICYDQKVPESTKFYFPNFFRRQYMKWFYWANERSKQGADKYWELSKIKQKPKWTKKTNRLDFSYYQDADMNKPYAIYLGRTSDYKNYDWLKKTMEELNIPLIHPLGMDGKYVHQLLSNAKLLVTASLWEGYGRPVMEAQALGIPVVCYDVGVHKKLVTNGYVIPLDDKTAFKEAVRLEWNLK